MGKDVKAVDRQQLGGHRASPDKRLLQDRCKWAEGACVFLSGLSPQGRAVPKPLCCDVLTVEGVYQTMGYTSVWELFLVTTSGVECCRP